MVGRLARIVVEGRVKVWGYTNGVECAAGVWGCCCGGTGGV